MREDFLHYVWQFQAYSREGLATESGEPVRVLHPGHRNAHAGPDFSEAHLKVGDVEWHGPVEIHIKASDWYAHKHQTDTAYDKVVLHVVWEADRPVHRQDGSIVPVLVLQSRVSLDLQHRYQKLAERIDSIPCADQFAQVREITKLNMLDKALMSRLEGKSQWMAEVGQAHLGDWDVVAYQALARTFGFRVNRDPMWELSRRIPLKLILKHQQRLDQLEALLLGGAGFLENPKESEPYYQILRAEWRYLAHKYSLEAPNPPLPWKYGRVRPANQPHLRVAQLAALLSQEGRIFAMLREVTSLKDLMDRFNVAPSMYWQRHHRFGKASARPSQGIGKSSVQIIIINTVAPLLVAYGKSVGNQAFVEKAVEMLQHLPAEDNAVVRQWNSLGLSVSSAFDSQALIGQHEGYCTQGKCLQCPVGISLLRNGQ